MKDYIISYTHGSGGNFLTAIIERNVTRKTPYEPIKQGRFNDAHQSLMGNQNVEVDMVQDQMNRTPEGNFLLTRKISPWHSVFLDTHMYNPTLQLSKWPDVQLSVILHQEEDIWEISANGLYKTDLSLPWHQNQVTTKGVSFSLMNSTFDNIRKKHPLNYTQEERLLALDTRRSITINSGFHLITPIQDDPRVKYIQYRTLVSDIEGTVAFVESVSEQPILDEVVQDIKGYQERQANFVESLRAQYGVLRERL